MPKRSGNDMEEKRIPRCSFCGKSQDEVERLIAGRNAFICNECVELCVSVIGEDYAPGRRQLKKKADELKQEGLPKPREIKAFLDQYIVGQEQAKVTISVAVSLSTVNALTLSPVLCTLLLKPADPHRTKFIFFHTDIFKIFVYVFSCLHTEFYNENLFECNQDL